MKNHQMLIQLKKKFDDVLLTFCGKRAQAKGTMNMRKQPTPITWQRNVSFKANERRMKERKKKRNLERTVESWSRFEPRLLLHLLEMIMVSMVINHEYYDYNGQWQFMNDKTFLHILFGTFMMNGRQNMPGAAIITLEVTTCTSYNKGYNLHNQNKLKNWGHHLHKQKFQFP